MLFELHRIAEVTEGIALKMIWDQWAVLGSDESRTLRRARESLVDPDALILLTLSLIACDERLERVSLWWAHTCAPLSSVKRIRRLLPLFPRTAGEGVRNLAGIVLRATKDTRWKSLAGQKSVSRQRPIIDPRPVDVLNPSSLVLRMRLIFGVNPTADVITYLLSRGSQPATARQIHTATAYGRSSIHRILDGLVAAKIVGRIQTRPATFMLCAEAWQEMLGRSVVRTDLRGRVGFRRGFLKFSGAPMWLCWVSLFSFLAILQDESRRAFESGQYRREALNRARRHFQDSRRVFFENRLMLPALNPYGDLYIWSLLDNLSKISDWYSSDA